MPFIPNSDADREEMMDALGINSVEDLFSDIPENVRVKEDWLEHPGLSESSVLKYFSGMAEKNFHAQKGICFLGAGVYDHFIPSIVKHASSRSEFTTAYTPYQPEVSQGTLQAIYEYQTMICELTGMDVSNASMYCGVSATAEAVLLATSSLSRKSIAIAENLPENYKQVMKSYCYGRDVTFIEVPCNDGAIDLEAFAANMDEECAGLVVQYPNYYGIIEPLDRLAEIVHNKGGYLIASVSPITLPILRTPGECGVDIVTGEGQTLGNEMNHGGPFLGIFAVKQSLVRQLPGRLVGLTEDLEGRPGFVLTLQTREQHIRREKATSNICTNQGLMMLRACIYMETMGKEGIREVALQSTQKAHYLAEKIDSLPGFSLKFNKPFFNEFVIECPDNAEKIVKELLKDNILAGITLADLGQENGLLVAVTEQRTKEEMDLLVEKLKKFAK